uniref:Sodium/calcium exchanger membrane region domain-containing protein n=1 Tax=Chromera velia CCMP2878 TaxID=1169474 RepID=A0A0G4HGR6_9ALVE|eukprot:Cvel_27425.t1-p1 / transcript=Cvel_27425.t1 / gene=Cvel_27425 / organism=Chromera_velia_CCMP2878 / gene_product=Vacuolar calcium ion transporter, putative / transcript_product=Vacuolar calcium ion transporter, putative / location=Cvel_scaffold3419:10279-16798(+) / protein_length=528 / sequence_SO=supercontig / SO=protein_coding / is_pseudo=false
MQDYRNARAFIRSTSMIRNNANERIEEHKKYRHQQKRSSVCVVNDPGRFRDFQSPLQQRDSTKGTLPSVHTSGPFDPPNKTISEPPNASGTMKRHTIDSPTAAPFDAEPSSHYESFPPHGEEPGVHGLEGDTGGDWIKKPFSVSEDLTGVKDMLFTKLNILLIFVPLGALSSFLHWGELATFSLNFIALIPLAALLGEATEELALHTGETIGGLLNATFGNAVEMILVVQSLRLNLVTVVQGTLLGSILSNLLLVLGTSLWLGGCYFKVQKFNVEGARSNAGLLLLACLTIALPTVYKEAGRDEAEDGVALQISHIVAIIAIVVYVLFIYFQLFTHVDLFTGPSEEDQEASKEKEREGVAPRGSNGVTPSVDSTLQKVPEEGEEEAEDDDEEDAEVPNMSWKAAATVLFAVTCLTAYQSELLVGTIEEVTERWKIPEAFIGVILLPIVGNACEHLTAVSVAMKNKLDLTLGVAVGSSTQIALFVTPFAVLVGWAMGVEMTLDFRLMETCIMILSSLIVISQLVSQGIS